MFVGCQDYHLQLKSLTGETDHTARSQIHPDANHLSHKSMLRLASQWFYTLLSTNIKHLET